MMHRQKENGVTLRKDDVVSGIKKLAKENAVARESRILLVDDEADIVAVYKQGLTRGGFAVKAYNDPEKALSHFKPDAFDMAILDIRMPKMSGFELCREIRKKDEKVRVCFMTAFEINRTEFEKVIPSIRVDGFITKPVRIADLCSTVQQVLGNVNGRTR